MKITKDINFKIFREYDIRGVYGQDLNEDVAYTIGKAFGSYVKLKGESKVLLGHDNRDSHSVLYPSLMQGILDCGVNVLSLGLLTTPMHNFAKIYYDVNCAIMVTASHNPKEYNGFKISTRKEDSLFGDELMEFMDFLKSYEFIDGIGYVYEENIMPAYFEELKKSINLGDRKVKVVVDAGNGTGSIFIENILKMFNVEYDLLFCDSDSSFPNHTPDPAVMENMSSLGKRVVELGYDIGLAVDGDCDRCGMVLEDGTYVPADLIMLLFYRNLAPKLSVRKGVFDVKCSKSLIDELERLGIDPCMNRTGAVYCRRYVMENNLDFGGEFSGHLFFRDRYLGYDDGIYAILRLIEILSKTDKSVSQLFKGINEYYSTGEVKIEVTEENKFDIVKSVIDYASKKKYNYNLIDGIRVSFDDGWALVRASNTGPNLTLRFEAASKKRLKEIEEEFKEVLEKAI
ncbi:MAG: phosphomannomutase/phosphoglucomutase [Bacilli bacterium]|nr:phosphomannomutase/phosphoglucomutase [Bacilli bacterium]